MAALPELLSNARHEQSGDPRTRNLTEYYTRIGEWCDAAYEEGVALQETIPELNEVQTSLDYLNGLQWKEAMPSYRARPVNNDMLAMFWETIGLLTDVKPLFRIEDMAASGTGEYSKIESLLNLLARGWASTMRFERSLAFCTMFGMMTSAPAKVYWNPFARGDSGDPQDGDLSFESLPARSILRLGAGDTLQDDECVIYRRSRTLDWICRAYPTMGKLVTAEDTHSKYTVVGKAPINVSPVFQQPSPQMQRLMGINRPESRESVYPMAEVAEYWKKDDSINESRNIVRMGPKDMPWSYDVHPGKRLYPRGRVIIRSNGVTLYDEPNPYYCRKKPFAMLSLYDVPWQQWAMSVIRPWMRQQDILNQILAGLLNNVKRANNPALIAAKSAINPEAMRAIDTAKPNLKITYNGMAGTAPSWSNPPTIPPYVLQAYGIVQKSMSQSSGASGIGDALGKKQVPGSDTLDRISFSRNTPIRLMGRNVENFVDEIGGMWTAGCLQFYDAARRMELLADKGIVKEDIEPVVGSLIPGGIDSEGFVRRWRFKCDKGTLLNVQRQDRLQISFALRRNHDLSRRKIFQMLDWNIDQKENDAELAQEAEAMAKAQAAAGIKPRGHK